VTLREKNLKTFRPGKKKGPRENSREGGEDSPSSGEVLSTLFPTFMRKRGEDL